MKILDEIVQTELETDEHPQTLPHLSSDEIVAESQAPAFRLQRRTFLGLFVILLLFGGLFSLMVWKKGAHNENQKPATENQAAAAAPELSSDLVTAEEDELKQITIEPVVERRVNVEQEATGRVAFNEDRQTPVFTPYAGRVVEVLANKGDLVRQGQPLLIVESPELVATENDLAAARADLEKDRIALDTAQKNADRARALLEREAIAAKDLQLAEADLARAKEEVNRSDAAVAVVKNKLALFGKDAKEIAQIEKRPAGDLDRRIVIRAPISGTIVERKVGAGQYLKPDAPDPLYLIADLSTLWVLGDVYESFLPHIRVGAPVKISVAAFPDRSFPARVSFINPTVDPVTRTIHVRAVVQNNGVLKPEMFAKITIGASTPQSFPAVLSSAVISVNNGAAVLVEESHGRFRRREIKPAREEDGFTLIESGLKPGERVVTKGVLLLNNGVGKPPEAGSQ
ncbi:MAG: efflux RND transporter periplasmic adaptor subunit [Acidobacteria bacterium]|nr:efflux RND transporter periplasmic adaptor subunit [Acidobacteriota bacterium]